MSISPSTSTVSTASRVISLTLEGYSTDLGPVSLPLPVPAGATLKRCPRCGLVSTTPELHFNRDARLSSGFSCYCKECNRTDHKRWEMSLTEEQRERKRRLTRERYHTAKAAKLPQTIEQQSAQRSKQSHSSTLVCAIEDGKTSPVTRQTGFSIAFCQVARTYRAARLDMPLQMTEIPCAEYKLIRGEWQVFEPSVSSPMARILTERLGRLEEALSRHPERQHAANVPTAPEGSNL